MFKANGGVNKINNKLSLIIVFFFGIILSCASIILANTAIISTPWIEYLLENFESILKFFQELTTSNSVDQEFELHSAAKYSLSIMWNASFGMVFGVIVGVLFFVKSNFYCKFVDKGKKYNTELTVAMSVVLLFIFYFSMKNVAFFYNNLNSTRFFDVKNDNLKYFTVFFYCYLNSFALSVSLLFILTTARRLFFGLGTKND